MDQKQMNQKQCETEKKKEQQGLCEDFLDKVLVAKFSIVPQSHKWQQVVMILMMTMQHLWAEDIICSGNISLGDFLIVIITN